MAIDIFRNIWATSAVNAKKETKPNKDEIKTIRERGIAVD